MVSNLVSSHKRLFKESGRPIYIHFAPGRVNLIGEHTDYNGGLVFPCTIKLGTYLTIQANNENKWCFKSLNFCESYSIDIDKPKNLGNNEWVNYPLGVINELLAHGLPLQGINFLYEGNIPNGAGLSSSASVELVTAFALNELFKLDIPLVNLVKLCQRAENEFVGTQCGIMDQFAIGFGKKDHAILLDCKSLEYHHVYLALGGYSIVITDCKKPRKLVESKYNDRRKECRLAFDILNKNKNALFLSDFSIEDIENNMDLKKEEVLYKRAKHVVYENNRVKQAFELLKKNSLKEFGELMNQSHFSLRDNYEVTGFELDTLTNISRSCKGTIGSRMTGAGFGGCTVSIVENKEVNSFKRIVSDKYTKATGLKPEFYISTAWGGPHSFILTP